jgi:glycosyltransferase involved in cell wall biosynthesis
MKICFIIPTLTGGGAERVAVTVLSALDGARHERVLYLFSDAGGVYFDRIGPGVRVVVATQRSWLLRLWELASFLRSSRPDIVMPFLSYFITALAVRVARVPSRVVFNQGTPTSGFLDDPDFSWRTPWRRRVFAALTRMFYRRADAVVVTSQGVADDLAANYHVPAAKIRVLHNPVDLDAIAAAAGTRSASEGEPAEHHPLVAAAGRLAGVKNYPLLIDALAELAPATPVHAWILGDGAERAQLERQIADRGLGRLITFLGFQPNPWRFIARADVFVLTSTYEGFGNVLIEAMACGTPVVATRSPGTVEIIEHGSNGLLVDHEPRAVAGAIANLIGDATLRERLIARGRESVRHYAVPRVVERYDRLFEELVA